MKDMEVSGTQNQNEFCPCCGEPTGVPGLPCSFCGYAHEISQDPSYREVFDQPFRCMEIHDALERLDQMLLILDRIDRELAETCGVFSS